MSNFYTSDTHFNHTNILKYCPNTRKFSSVEDMNNTLVSNWNSKVSKNDDVYCLGDMFFGKDFSLLSKLNGRIHLIKGNHDHKLVKEKANDFESINDILTVKDGDYRLVLCHYRFYEWDGFYRDNVIHLHGHSHGEIPSTKKAIDIGVDNPLWNFQPVSLEEILKQVEFLPEHQQIKGE